MTAKAKRAGWKTFRHQQAIVSKAALTGCRVPGHTRTTGRPVAKAGAR